MSFAVKMFSITFPRASKSMICNRLGFIRVMLKSLALTVQHIKQEEFFWRLDFSSHAHVEDEDQCGQKIAQQNYQARNGKQVGKGKSHQSYGCAKNTNVYELLNVDIQFIKGHIVLFLNRFSGCLKRFFLSHQSIKDGFSRKRNADIGKQHQKRTHEIRNIRRKGAYGTHANQLDDQSRPEDGAPVGAGFSCGDGCQLLRNLSEGCGKDDPWW